jgi:hypothetical protein
MDKYDPRYQRGKIYTITCEDGNVYVGSTIQTLNDRFNGHKTKNQTCSMYQYIHNNYNGDWSKCKIELYENYPCKNEYELEKKEGEITRIIGTINKVIAGRTRKEWYNDNIDVILEKKKEYYQNNIEQMFIKNKKYYKNNKEIIKQQNKEYRIKNAEQVKEYERNRKNKKERAEYGKQIIECDCGCLSTRTHLLRHKTTKKHQELMDNQKSQILLFLECF